MKNTITVAIVQSALYWEDIDKNLSQFEDMMDKIPKSADLVVFPETFSTGFTMNVASIGDSSGKTLAWMHRMAEEHKKFIAGSCIIQENGNYHNRLFWATPEGEVEYYDKRHLFRVGREQEQFTSGDRRVITDLGPFRILLQICYDLRFPVFSRNRGDYDAILYVANWPAVRQHVWDTLLTARAMENQAYVIGVNRTGVDGEGVEHTGGSCVIAPTGIIKARLNHQPGLLVSSLDIQEIRAFRSKFPASEDADDFQLL
ncbi:MAG: amidohydrolase [Bacteroidales bacterium]